MSKKKTTVVISTLMQSSNQKVNALESIIGIFLHASKAPKWVIQTLSHMGISISVDLIHQAITSLSAESANTIRNLGQTLTIAYAYDNFDVDLKCSLPMAKGADSTLKHLTSALLFPLQHGVTADDMKCSDELWQKSNLNPNLDPSLLPRKRTWKDLILTLTPPEPWHASGLSKREHFNSWKFLYDLCHYGPPYFAQFQADLAKCKPEEIDAIRPIIKTPIYPAHAMEYSNSTVSGNISTIENLMEQGGVGNPKDVEMKYVVEEHFSVPINSTIMVGLIWHFKPTMEVFLYIFMLF